MMKQYRDPDIVTEELHETQLIIEEIKRALEKVPDDVATHLMLAQEEQELARLTKELEEALTHQRRHTIKLAMQTYATKYRADKLSDILDGFQELLNRSLQVVKGGGKKSAVPLYLHTTYRGSFGLMMSTQNEESLFGESEKAIAYVFDTFALMDEVFQADSTASDEELLKHFKNDPKLIAKAKKFYKSIADTEDDVKLEWGSYEKESVKVSISNTTAKRFYAYLKKKSDEVIKDVKITGVVKGVSLLKNEIDIVKEDKSVITASFEDELSDVVSGLMNEKITGVFNIKHTYNSLHESEVERYELVRLSGRK